MGFNTTYLGRLDIEPPLNPAEVEWLRAHAALHDPGAHGYDLPLNPRAHWTEQHVDPESRYEDAAYTAPSGSCDWTPCVQGCCLHWTGAERSNNAEPWLRHLVAHFLRPGALARGGHPAFDEFTFDHVVNGVIAARRGDTRELFLIRARDNEISREVLVHGDVWDSRQAAGW